MGVVFATLAILNSIAAMIVAIPAARADESGWRGEFKIEPDEIAFMGTLPPSQVWIEGKPFKLNKEEGTAPEGERNTFRVADKQFDLSTFQGNQFLVHYRIPSGESRLRVTFTNASGDKWSGDLPYPSLEVKPLTDKPLPLTPFPSREAQLAWPLEINLPEGFSALDPFLKPMNERSVRFELVAREGRADSPIILQSAEGVVLYYRIVSEIRAPEGIDLKKGESPANALDSFLKVEPVSAFPHRKTWLWSTAGFGAACALAAAITWFNTDVQKRYVEDTDDPAREKTLRDRIKIEEKSIFILSVAAGASFGAAATIAFAW